MTDRRSIGEKYGDKKVNAYLTPDDEQKAESERKVQGSEENN